MTLNYKFRGKESKVVGGIKENLMRIAQKINDKEGKAIKETDKTFRISDIIRATIIVTEPD